jgi:spore coat protein A
MELSRRDLLKVGILGSATMLLPIERIARTKAATLGRLSSSQLPKAFQRPLPISPVLAPTPVPGLTGVDFYEITMKQGAADILGNGKLTKVWGYNGITPGPTISVPRGRKAIVRQINGLTEDPTDPRAKPLTHPTLGYQPATSVHLHGSASLPQYDGYASDVTKVGEYKDYHYPNIQDARTLWYHDHGVHQTASNAYMGLAAQYHLHDDVEARLPIPKGKYDVSLTVRDAIFATDGQLIYDDNSESSIMGDVILVNGAPQPLMKVEPRKYRFRILNASVSRSYRFALTTAVGTNAPQEPMTVIATDGGLMPFPQTVTSFRHGMAERYEIIIDFAKYKPTTPGTTRRVFLKNLSNPNNVDYASTKDVMCFDVGFDAPDLSNNEIQGPPDPLNKGRTLNPNGDVMDLQDTGITNRRFDLIRQNGSWSVNGKTWVDVLNSNNYDFAMANPADNSTEIWEIRNGSGGWFHPFHIHLVDFKILTRNGKPPLPHERGPKDVVYVGENEAVRVAMKFQGPENPDAKACYDEEAGRLGPGSKDGGQRCGRYMMHCHNLVHEDHDMMGQFWVGGPDGGDPYHPVDSAKAKSWPPSGGDQYLHAPSPDFVGF